MGVTTRSGMYPPCPPFQLLILLLLPSFVSHRIPQMTAASTHSHFHLCISRGRQCVVCMWRRYTSTPIKGYLNWLLAVLRVVFVHGSCDGRRGLFTGDTMLPVIHCIGWYRKSNASPVSCGIIAWEPRAGNCQITLVTNRSRDIIFDCQHLCEQVWAVCSGALFKIKTWN